MRRLLVSSEPSLDGKLFVQFVAHIYLFCLKKAMPEKKLFGKYMLQGLLDQFDVIECFGRAGKDLCGRNYQETTGTLKHSGVAPPPSL